MTDCLSSDKGFTLNYIYKPLSLLHQRADRSENHSSTATKTKAILQKAMSQMKGQDKIQEKQLSKVEIGNISEKEFRIMIVQSIQDFRKTMDAKIEKMQEMFNKDLKN